MIILNVLEESELELVLLVSRATMEDVLALSDKPIEIADKIYYDYRVIRYGYDFKEGSYKIYLEKASDLPNEIIVPEIGRDAALVNKITELKYAMQSAVDNGMEIQTDDGPLFFSLTMEDQMNLKASVDMANMGLPVSYHANDKICRIYSPDEINMLALEAFKHVAYHRTRFNHLKAWVKRLSKVDEIVNVHYGAELPEDLQQSLDEIMSTLNSK